MHIWLSIVKVKLCIPFIHQQCQQLQKTCERVWHKLSFTGLLRAEWLGDSVVCRVRFGSNHSCRSASNNTNTVVECRLKPPRTIELRARSVFEPCSPSRHQVLLCFVRIVTWTPPLHLAIAAHSRHIFWSPEKTSTFIITATINLCQKPCHPYRRSIKQQCLLHGFIYTWKEYVRKILRAFPWKTFTKEWWKSSWILAP